MSDNEKSGPSWAGKIVAVVSILLCAVLVIVPIPAWIGILVMIIWLFIGCPAVMKTDELKFWGEEGVDVATGCIGLLWWVVLTWQMGTTYTTWPWLLGMVLAVFSAIIVGKIARHWMNFVVMLLGFLLGWVILWLNWLARLIDGPLATSTLAGQSGWGQFTFIILTALVVLSIATVASCSYYADKICNLERELSKKRDGA